MKIVFIDTYPVRRGAQVFVSELAEFLELKGHETVKLYLYKSEKDAAQVSIREQDHCFQFNPKHLFEKIPTAHPVLVSMLVKKMEVIQPHIVLLNGSRTLKYGAIVKQFLPRSIKWISRVIDSAEFWNTGLFTHEFYKKLIIPAMDGSIGVSQSSLDAMIRHYDFHRPSTVIHRVFDPKKFQKAPRRDEARKSLGLVETDEVLLFLGNLTAQKCPDKFIEIVKKLSETRLNLKALIVGDGPLRKDLDKEVSGIKNQESIVKSQESKVKNQELRTKSQDPRDENNEVRIEIKDSSEGKTNFLFPDCNFLFAGYQQDVSPYLAAADLLVLTSDTEGLPGVVLEAAYFSVSTVATEVGGIRECLIDEVTGALVPDRSVAEFCRRINFLLDHPLQRQKMGEAAKDFVAQKFKMEHAAQQYLDFFNQLID